MKFHRQHIIPHFADGGGNLVEVERAIIGFRLVRIVIEPEAEVGMHAVEGQAFEFAFDHLGPAVMRRGAVQREIGQQAGTLQLQPGDGETVGKAAFDAEIAGKAGFGQEMAGGKRREPAQSRTVQPNQPQPEHHHTVKQPPQEFSLAAGPGGGRRIFFQGAYLQSGVNLVNVGAPVKPGFCHFQTVRRPHVLNQPGLSVRSPLDC